MDDDVALGSALIHLSRWISTTDKRFNAIEVELEASKADCHDLDERIKALEAMLVV